MRLLAVLMLFLVVFEDGCDRNKQKVGLDTPKPNVAKAAPKAARKLSIKEQSSIAMILLLRDMSCDIAQKQFKLAEMKRNADLQFAAINRSEKDLNESSDEFNDLTGNLARFPAAQEKFKAVRSLQRACGQAPSVTVTRDLKAAEAALGTELELISEPRSPEPILSDQEFAKQLKDANEAANQPGADEATKAVAEALKAEDRIWRSAKKKKP